LHPIFHL